MLKFLPYDIKIFNLNQVSFLKKNFANVFADAILNLFIKKEKSMKSLLACLLMSSISLQAVSLGSMANSLNASGCIDNETSFKLSYDADSQFGLLYLVKNDEPIKFKITEYIKHGSADALFENDVTLKSQAGDFFVPKWKSGGKATFNGKPVAQFVRAEDIYKMCYPDEFK
jgi:hypothetical protein